MISRPFAGLWCCIVFACLIAACTTGSDEPANTTANQPSDSLVVTLVCEDSSSVLDLLLATHEVDYRASSMGSFVTAIDSIQSGGGAFWLYSVNDTMVPLAADKMIVQPGDTVRWHLRKSGS